METFSALLVTGVGNSPVTSNAELWCFLWSVPWINGRVNNREAGDLRRHRAHYDVIVMWRKIGARLWKMEVLKSWILLLFHILILVNTNTETPTKWPPLCRRYYKLCFYQLKGLNFDFYFTENCSFGSDWQYASIGSDNCLTPNRRRAIIWNNDDLIHRRIYHVYASRGLS